MSLKTLTSCSEYDVQAVPPFLIFAPRAYGMSEAANGDSKGLPGLIWLIGRPYLKRPDKQMVFRGTVGNVFHFLAPIWAF